jgi:hypothetical protein
VTDAAHEAGDGQLSVPARDTAVSLGQATLSGLRQPIVAILLLIALFTTISGKPLDGFLMLTVATLLIWDAARARLRGSLAAGSQAASAGLAGGLPPGYSALSTPGPGYPAVSAARPARLPQADAAAGRITAPARRKPRRLLAGAGWLTGGGLFAGVVGTFSRYSWPATVSVVGLGCLMVAVGWQGPLRQRQPLTGQPLRRAWLWAVALVTGGVWELSSLLQQPRLTTDSYAHPTISALTDPLLASHPGRSVVLGLWLLIGWFLVGR